jgi:Tetracyclin repressor-like, C-terminal domain
MPSAARTSSFGPIYRRHAVTRERITSALATRYETPRGRLLGVFDVLGETAAEPGFRGCAFINASAESLPGGVVEEVSDESRAWLHSLFVELAREAGATDPTLLARQLALLYDGASVGARMDRDHRAANAARAVAMVLLDAATRP